MIYVVGSGGYIGRTLLEHFGNDARGIGRGTPHPVFSKEDVIINCAARGWKDGDEDSSEVVESNILLPMRLHEQRNGAGMIHLSSGIEIVMPGGSLYAKTKGIASDFLRGKAHVLYLYTIWGGKYIQMKRFMNTMISACAKGEPFKIETPMHTRDFVHIDHLVSMIESLLQERDYETVHVGNGKPVSFIEAYRKLVDVTGREFDNVDIDCSNLSRFRYCAPRRTVPDTFAADIKREWDIACA